MKKLLLHFAGIALAIFFSANLFAQTVGTLTFSFTPLTQSPGYSGTKNDLAVWIQNTTGTFVKTKLRYVGSGTSDHLPTWAVNSGGTAGNALSTACNKFDATTGATLANFSAKSFVWDGKNCTTTANGTTVADGTYKVTIQETWNHGTGGTVTTSFTFTKGPVADHQTPASTTYFSTIKLDWVPVTSGVTVTTSVVNVKCFGGNTGSATATPAGGTPPYTYSWNTSPVQNTATATGLAAGSYTVTVQNASGSTTSVASVTQPASALSSNATSTNANCGSTNGTASATASGGTGGYTYLWSNGKTTANITGLSANAYTVTVTDANGCTSTHVANVLNSGAPTASIAPTNVSGCFGNSNGSATVNASGGTGTLTYSWNTTPVQNTPTAIGLAAGTYTATVTDATGCYVKVATTITQPAAIANSLTPTDASSCSVNDGKVTSSISGGTPTYTYLWSNGKTTSSITGLGAGTYSLTVTDANGCTKVSSAVVNCTSGGSNDAGVNAVSNPNGSICASSFAPTVTIKNFGTTTLTSCTINFYVDNPPASAFNWVGSLASGATGNVNLPVISGISVGAHTFYCSTSNPNGGSDVNTGNDQSQSNFNVSATTTAIPLIEGFETSGNFPAGWALSNPDNDAAWQVVPGIAATGVYSMGFDNCDGNGPGAAMNGLVDRISTNAYDFTSATASASMTFDLAYAVLNYHNITYADTLAIYASSDCGTTWNRVYYKGGATLSSITTSTSCWAPNGWDWVNENVNLGSYSGQSSVMFAFENVSGWGEWIYLDNINILSSTGVENINPLAGFSIYPNPAGTSFTIEGSCNSAKINYTIYDLVGSEVKTGAIVTTGNSFNGKVQVSDISRGMYFIKINDGKNTWTQKVNLQ